MRPVLSRNFPIIHSKKKLKVTEFDPYICIDYGLFKLTVLNSYMNVVFFKLNLKELVLFVPVISAYKFEYRKVN